MKARIWGGGGAGLVLLLGGAALAASGRAPLRYAAAGTGYAAHVVCSCRYVGNRSLASCKTDLEPGLEIVDVSDDPAARRVTARVPLLSTQSARFDPQFGCLLEPG